MFGSKKFTVGSMAVAALFAGMAPFVTPSQFVLAQAPAAGRQLGTVKSVNGSTLVVAGDKGESATVTLSDSTKVVQLAPGSTDLKTAQPAAASDIAAGDRVLAIGTAGDGGAIAATRVVLMKSSDIAQRNAASQADWARRGSGGLVATVDKGAGTIAIKQGQKAVTISTSAKTVFRRYAADSVKFEDAKPGTLADIQPGDQMRVRGSKNEDGTTIAADEIVSGSFKNLAGTVSSIDAATGKLVLKDLTLKKNVTVMVTANSDLRSLPPEMATRLAARARGGDAAGAAPAGGGAPAGMAPAAPPARPAGVDPAAAGGEGRRMGPGGPGGAGGFGGQGGPGGPGGARGGAGMDLAAMLARLPNTTLAGIKNGDALMIVGTGSTGGDAVTAVTLLTGVEPILAAPNGATSMTLAPWSMGGGGGDAQ